MTRPSFLFRVVLSQLFDSWLWCTVTTVHVHLVSVNWWCNGTSYQDLGALAVGNQYRDAVELCVNVCKLAAGEHVDCDSQGGTETGSTILHSTYTIRENNTDPEECCEYSKWCGEKTHLTVTTPCQVCRIQRCNLFLPLVVNKSSETYPQAWHQLSNCCIVCRKLWTTVVLSWILLLLRISKHSTDCPWWQSQTHTGAFFLSATAMDTGNECKKREGDVHNSSAFCQRCWVLVACKVYFYLCKFLKMVWHCAASFCYGWGAKSAAVTERICVLCLLMNCEWTCDCSAAGKSAKTI